MALIDLYKKLYPVGARVAYTRGFEGDLWLGIVDGYQIGLYGEHGPNMETYVNVRDCEFPDYVQHARPGKELKKVYYTIDAVKRDKKNRAFF